MVGHIRIIVIGRVGTDPEMRYSAQGVARTTFRFASSRYVNTPGGERQEETEWFTVVAFRQLAEQANQFLVKGQRAYVEGRLHSRSYEANDGKARFVNEIVADRILFLDRASTSGPGVEGSPAPAPEAGQVEAEDLPF
ncbi:MAG: single-stranded DNA-binding protein [Dehalococcoidia bacterium]|nr:single-stranded DNA-binding protein [Dehalococcoidia bacterium]